MTARRVLSAVLLCALPGLAGCGLAAGVAQTTTRAAMAPVTATAREVSRGVESVSRSVERSAIATRRAARQTAAAAQAQSQRMAQLQQLQRMQRQPPYRTTSPAFRPASTHQRSPAAALPSGAGEEPPESRISLLPAATLAQLTDEQRELQNAAQTVALDSPSDEIIYWDQDDRSGTATADEEYQMGGFTCREVTQSVTIDGSTEEASGTACHSGDNRWTLAF